MCQQCEMFHGVLLAMLVVTLSQTLPMANGVVDTRGGSKAHHSHKDFIQVDVTPADNRLTPWGSVTVKCFARSQAKQSDIVVLNFYRQLDKDTVMPMSSTYPGVLFRPVANFHDGQSNRSRHRLRRQRRNRRRHGKRSHKFRKNKGAVIEAQEVIFSKETYFFLNKGKNIFYCQGWTSSGTNTNAAYFTIQRE